MHISCLYYPLFHFPLLLSLFVSFVLLCVFYDRCLNILTESRSRIMAVTVTVQPGVASAIIKQLITCQISAITVRCGQMPRWEARGSTTQHGWHWGAGAWANKSPISKIISVQKQIEAAGEREAFLGHSAKQINHLFSYAVWVAVAVISGEPSVCLRSWCAEHHSMIVAPGRDIAAVSCLFSMAHYSFSSVYLLDTIFCSLCYWHRSALSHFLSRDFPSGHSQFRLSSWQNERFRPSTALRRQNYMMRRHRLNHMRMTVISLHRQATVEAQTSHRLCKWHAEILPLSCTSDIKPQPLPASLLSASQMHRGKSQSH